MSKSILSVLAAALVCVAASSVLANEGTIASGTLNDMGLSALQVMSDSQAMEIRGMGYEGGHDGYKKKKDDRPNASASGNSWANVELGGNEAHDGHRDRDGHDGGDNNDGGSADAGSRNSYKANGKYEASGANFSEATLEVVDIHQVDYTDGTTATETTTHRVHVEAGGFSSAKAF